MTARAAAAAAAAAGAGRMLAWRAHAYGGAARLEAARVPALRAPDQLLVRVRAASLNPLDAAMLRGYGARALNRLRALAGDALEFPLVCGRDFVGDVALAGPGARLRRGERVWGALPPHQAGAHAQYVLVRDRWAGRAPGALSEAQCGGAPFAALSASAAVRGAGRVRRALVLGLGGVGQAALQLLAARGAAVTVGARADAAPLAAALGAVAALDRDAPDYYHQIEANGPYCAVLDCAGVGGGWAGVRAARGARFVTLAAPLLRETDARGLAAGAAAAAGTLAAHNWAAGAGAGAGAACPRVRWAFFRPRAADLELVRRLAESGRFRVVVERVFPWWAADEAYEHAAKGGARGKLVLDWTVPAPAAL